ncbi:hypothetical protein [Seonamhaeicola aphaedonensis]|uniref:Uncharacterized protein n=1 Tax=Seonamhaeicola aphaedonensis TaxID=1461338 RepID=A0A3D9H819_9FLAO|nr:hypothetical protein [Seonamhaeicola aphaedonensis]RED45643.1 hypothetical protein DFQ02_10821 [Seonamhaeicola aphaedonensis]
MMNKRYLNTALMVLLVIVWGAVIYKFFGKKKTVMTYQDSGFVSNNNMDFTFSKDTFQLELLNEDPFKASKPFSRPNPIKVAKVKSTSVSKPSSKKPITWPTISYHGFVKANGNATKLIVLKIDNTLYRIRENETINAIKLIKAYDDSLKIAFNKDQKTIKRQ